MSEEQDEFSERISQKKRQFLLSNVMKDSKNVYYMVQNLYDVSMQSFIQPGEFYDFQFEEDFMEMVEKNLKPAGDLEIASEMVEGIVRAYTEIEKLGFLRDKKRLIGLMTKMDCSDVDMSVNSELIAKKHKEALELIHKKIEEQEIIVSKMEEKKEKIKKILLKCVEPEKTLSDEIWDFHFFGSVANGFVVATSDFDCTVIVNEKYSSPEFLREIPKKIDELNTNTRKKIKEISKPKLIDSHKVRIPVLKLIIRSNEEDLEVDFSFDNLVGVINSHLLKHYSMVHKNVLELGMSIKLWAKAKGISGASKAYLSSYAVILMMLFFLVYKEYIPNLQKHDPNEAEPLILVRLISGKVEYEEIDTFFKAEPITGSLQIQEKDVVTLLEEFFDFYKDVKSFQNQRICLRNGQKKDRVSEEEKGYLFSIEDPFENNYNPGSKLKKGTPEAEKFDLELTIASIFMKRKRVDLLFKPN